MIDAADVFNPKDFESIRLEIYFQNLTTRTEIKDRSKCTLQELRDKTMVLELPAKTCNTKHSVMVTIYQIEKKSPKPQELLNLTGKILEMEEVDDDTVRATIEAVQVDEKSWQDLQAVFASRQEEITKFIAATKGY